ncbi:MAG: trans-2-enoyl-CoA reductase family protein [Planctomycetes bacterium]|nr:trans-2-enoyl-CoA reductase family protein [Planctomycetota bacterium]
MAKVVINPRIRGFICLTAHPAGCAANVRRQIDVATKAGPGKGIANALVIGSSAGYGLASLITLAFGHGANVLGACFERPPQGEKAGSAGWYNLAEVHRLAKDSGRKVETINGDAFAAAGKQAVVDALKARFGKLDYIVYSVATPKRTDPATGTTYASVLKPIGQSYTAKTIDLDADQVKPITINPAVDAEIEATVKVMGGDDWAMWIEALTKADLLAKGCRTVAYSYIGPQITHAIYRAGTIGRAKDHLEATAKQLDAQLRAKVGGRAVVSVNKALVTQASSAIPVVPLYISLLYKVMKEKGCHEGTIEQMVRLWRDHLGPGKEPKLDEHGRVRIDDWEMRADVQQEAQKRWESVTSENLLETSDYAGFKREFRQLYGFELDGVDYVQPVEVDRPLV